jgi:hypothetical protein
VALPEGKIAKRARSHVVVASCLLSMALTAVACVSSPFGGNRAAAALCGAPNLVVGLTVTRTNAFPQNGFVFPFPAHDTSTDAHDVSRLARIACQLPVIPPGVRNCPADFGISYGLTFSTKSGNPVATIDARSTGCTGVSRLGAARSSTQEFWNTLALALNVPTATDGCDPFRGVQRVAPQECGWTALYG